MSSIRVLPSERTEWKAFLAGVRNNEFDFFTT
jgi:hypothetical protein